MCTHTVYGETEEVLQNGIQKQNAKDELEVIEYKRVMSKHDLDKMNSQIILLRILDSAFAYFVKKNKNILSSWFIQAIKGRLH